MARSPRNNNANDSDESTARPEKKRPIHSIRRWSGSGSVEIAIFEKEIAVLGQSPVVTFFATATKSYKDDRGNYQNVSAFNPHELLVLAHAAEEAYRWMNEQQDRE